MKRSVFAILAYVLILAGALLACSKTADATVPEPLHGVNVAGAEYACVEGWGLFDTPTGTLTDANLDAIVNWAPELNTIRLPVNETCWLGEVAAAAGIPAAYSGANYKATIKSAVDRMTARGLYVIVDLHRTAPGTAKSLEQDYMANMGHSLDFWTQMATRFDDNPQVLYGLFNEPHGITWSCWLNGGCTKASVNGGRNYTVAGVNDLISAVRATGAPNTLVVGGLAWTERALGILTHAPSDPLNDLMVDAHVYDFNTVDTPAEYDVEYAPVAAVYPMIFGETGPSLDAGTEPGACPASAIDPASSFSTNTLDWADAHGVSYTAWAWNPWTDSGSGCWALTTNWSGTPSSVWGAAYQGRLQ